MAINVDTVYKTVLLILNKEQRGYLTPDEFNKTATQVQLEIFNEYFEGLNQQLRVPDNDSEYADRIKNIDGEMSIFKTVGNCTIVSGSTWSLPSPTNFYRLGTVIYNDEIEVQRIQRNDLLYINKSPLTKPTKSYPVYLYEDSRITLYPTSINTGISVSYIRKPADIIWNFTAAAPSYTYIYNPTSSVQFELSVTEQTNVITRILLYSGVIVNDPEIVQVAAQQIQQEQINSKS